MNDMYLFIVFAASAYVLQAVISWKQLKHFNQTYSELRRKGKVAIGKRPGKIRSSFRSQKNARGYIFGKISFITCLCG